MKQQRRLHRAMWFAPVVGAAACWLTHSEPSRVVPTTPASNAESQATSESIVLTGGVEPVVEYVPGADDVRTSAPRKSGRTRTKPSLPAPNAAATTTRGGAPLAVAVLPSPNARRTWSSAPTLGAPSAGTPVVEAVDDGGPSGGALAGDVDGVSDDALAAEELAGDSPYAALQPPLPPSPLNTESDPVAPELTMESTAEPVIEEPIVDEPIVEESVVEESVVQAPRSRQPGFTQLVGPHTASPAPSAPVVEVVEVDPPAVAAPVENAVAPRVSEEAQPQAPLASAPLVASPYSAMPVVTPVDGEPTVVEPVAPESQEPQPEVATSPPAAAEPPVATESVTNESAQRWASMQPPPSPATPGAGYPTAPQNSAIPTLSEASPAGQAPGFGPPKIFGELLKRPNPRSPETLTRSRDLEMVARRADAHTLNGFELASRRAFLSARSEFVQALRLMSEALDVHQGTDRHSRALSEGLRALEESDEFLPTGKGLEDDINVRLVAQSHRSQVLSAEEAAQLEPLEARQRYYTFAQEQLAIAGGGEMAFSMALHGLGKLHQAFAALPETNIRAAEPKALVLQQASVMVDSRNALAANELGVLLARYGRFEQAREALLHSARLSPQATTWHNLAVVHYQLGEQDLGQLAQLEAKTADERLRALAAQRNLSLNPNVQWMSPQEFSRTTSTDMGGPAAPAGAPVTTASQPARGGQTTRAR